VVCRMSASLALEVTVRFSGRRRLPTHER